MSQGPLQPGLAAAGLPYRPHPSLDEADRSPLNREQLTSAAVCLDVLATYLRPLGETPTVLSDVVAALIRVAELSGRSPPDIVPELVAHAGSSIGESRMVVAASLHDYAAMLTTTDVMGAVAQVREMAAHVIDDVRLRLESPPTPGYRQA